MASVDLASFGDLLRRARRAAGLTHEELAERSGLSVRGISDLERGIIRAPRRDTLELLADALDLPVAERRQWEQLRRKLSIRAEASRPTAQAASRAGNLPNPLTSLVGREREAQEVAARVAAADCRLVSLTGPGGVGKTRLAIEVGHLLWDSTPEGVWFIDLAPLNGADLVIPTIASTLGVAVAGAQSPYAALVDALRSAARLLILDNYEHVVDSAPDVARLLTACPLLSILATSRIALRIQGEREYPLAPLPLPVPASEATTHDVAGNASIVLFTQRAQAVRPDFQISDNNIEAVAEICHRLDGLPLALELAAARVRLLPPQAMLERMEPRLPLLVGVTRDVPDRQRTLKATIQWSYDLLNAEDQRLIRTLSVFRGGWTLEAAEAVADPSLDVLTGLQVLIDHSLVRVTEQPDGTARYTMLETVREYGLERLDVDGEREPVEDRFIGFFRQLAERAGPELQGPDQALWLALLTKEQGNLRSALRQSREQAKAGNRQAMSATLRFASALWWYWYLHGQLKEGGEHLNAAVQIFRSDVNARQLRATGNR